MKTPDQLVEAFRARGLKVTPQRQRVFQVLHGNDQHPTADAVHEAVRADLPTVSLRTVYQTLNDLAAMGEIRHLDLGTGSSRFDPNLDPHHHRVCERCGRVDDVCVDAPDLAPSDDDGGFVVTRTDIVFRGRCARCTDGADPDHRSRPMNQPQEAPIHG